MWAKLGAALVWALVAAAAVYWGLLLSGRSAPVPAQATVAGLGAGGIAADWSRVLGVAPPPPVQTVEAAPPPPPESSRFQLIGLVATRAGSSSSQGLALIAVDGKAPKAYRVGAEIDNGNVLQAVQQRRVAIGPRGGPATIALELPPLPPAATGVPGTGMTGLAGPPPAFPPGAPPGFPNPVNPGSMSGVPMPGAAPAAVIGPPPIAGSPGSPGNRPQSLRQRMGVGAPVGMPIPVQSLPQMAPNDGQNISGDEAQSADPRRQR